VQVGEPAELYFKPQDRFVAEFFSEVNRLGAIVENGMVETPLGSLPSSGCAEGSAVEVLIRPEAVTLSDDMSGPRAHVVEARLLGRTSLIHLAIGDPKDASAEPLHLHARVPGYALPEIGSEIGLKLNSSLTFVFEAKSAT